jgi:SAM-dependent methyltransferase
MKAANRLKIDPSIGYSSLSLVDADKKLIEVQNIKRVIDGYYSLCSNDNILVAGTGNGEEARLISSVFALPIYGVDINEGLSIRPDNTASLFLFRQDLEQLGFKDGSFSLVYCFHVLEHVNDPEAVLIELYRVIKPGGVLFIGFPNKNRLFSYFGTSQSATLVEKITWNFVDIWKRVTGKFENSLGAHAGFTEKEFLMLASPLFEITHHVRNEYMLTKYHSHKRIIQSIINTRMTDILFPSNYFICKKKA